MIRSSRLDRPYGLFASSTSFLSLTIFSLLHSASVLHSSVFCDVFMVTATLNLMTAYLNPYVVQIPYASVNQYFHSFIPVTGKLCNSFNSSVFPSYNLNAFKREVMRHPLIILE